MIHQRLTGYVAWADRQRTKSCGDKHVLLHLAINTDPEGAYSATLATIAASTYRGKRTVARSLLQLQADNLITIQRRRDSRSNQILPNTYRLNMRQQVGVVS